MVLPNRKRSLALVI